MTKETRTPEPLYDMDLCQGSFLIEINDPAGFRLGQLIAMATVLLFALLLFCIASWV
ncbi:hypothetical protein GWE18_40045 [Bradyrhizobium sp. CSA112]|uniref:hypothetical protein n=1 Tax=Bradyrhizobium sp. CSA112 TaxID=2699170 RepID=UPI0023AE9484|nr:hypothetical protein [Bradyrhizobium sp. CSA112]MDE5458821.1 hypothetical protein [Bradyrhizobium sp. CSA112]